MFQIKNKVRQEERHTLLKLHTHTGGAECLIICLYLSWFQGDADNSPYVWILRYQVRCQWGRAEMRFLRGKVKLNFKEAYIFTPLSLLHVLSHYKCKLPHVFLGFHVRHTQRRLVYNCDTQEKKYLWFQKSKKYWVVLVWTGPPCFDLPINSLREKNKTSVHHAQQWGWCVQGDEHIDPMIQNFENYVSFHSCALLSECLSHKIPIKRGLWL